MSTAKTCDKAGVCQARVPACPDCPERQRVVLPAAPLPAAPLPASPFAPGVVDGPYHPKPLLPHAPQVGRWLLGTAVLALAVALVGFVAGVLS